MAQAANIGGRSPLGMPFPYQRAFPEGVYKDLLKTVKECKRMCQQSGATYIQQVPMYTAALPYHWIMYPDDMTGFLQREITELAIKRTFEKEGLINWSTSLPTLYPLVTTGDGNCLLHAAALYMWGIEDTDLVLRQCLYELMNRGTFAPTNMKRWQAERYTTDPAMNCGLKYNTKDWTAEYDMLKAMADPTVSEGINDLPYKSLEEFHIFALANVLRRPIMVISNKKIRDHRGFSLQPQSVYGLYLPLHWDPSLCCKFPIVMGFSHNHFFPLIHTAPEDSLVEVDLMVSLTLHGEQMHVHFSLPSEDTDHLIRQYLMVDNFIHCPKNRETAVGLVGAKLNCTNMGRNFSVWDPYFDLAETKLRIYNEGEYNPGSSATQETEVTVDHNIAGNGHQYHMPGPENFQQQFQNLPPAARPSQRKPGQCKTAGCPYQPSMCTGDVCVECFNKNRRETCRSGNCLNKADIGMDGFCKVCHDNNKFQQQSSSNHKGPKQNDMYTNRGSSSSSPNSSPTSDEDRFKTNGAELDSLAVNTLTSGMEKCIIPECQLTGNPKTNDMCENCYRMNMEMVQSIGRSKQPPREEIPERREEVEDTRLRGKPDIAGRSNSDLLDRHTALLNQLHLQQSHRDKEEPRQRVLRAEQVQSAPVSAKLPAVITVQKDLCATAGCSGVRLKNSELCRGCKEGRKSTPVSRDEATIRSEPLRKDQQGLGPQRGQQLRREQVRNEQPMPQWERQEPPRRCKIRKCGQPAAPPEFKYCTECWEDIKPDLQLYPGRDVPTATRTGPAGFVPPEVPYGYPNPGQKYAERNIANQALQSESVPRQKNRSNQNHVGRRTTSSENIANTTYPTNRIEDTTAEHIQQQLRDQFQRPDRSDSSPTKMTPEVNFPQVKRNKCQRQGGCPDDMFGDPEKRNLCSKCWREVGQNPPRTNRVGDSGQRHHHEKHRNISESSNYYTQGPGQPMQRVNAWNQDRRQEHNPGYRAREDSGYQHSQEQLRYPQWNLSGGQMEAQGSRALPQVPDPYPEVREEFGSRIRTSDVYQSGELDRHLYEELEDHCAQPGCRRQAAANVEKFCHQCHENYKAIFMDHRQINN